MQALFPNLLISGPNTKFYFQKLCFTDQKERQQRQSISRVRVLNLIMEVKNLLKDKKFWFASFLIAWAAALQGHMIWLQRQDSFKQKFGNIDQNTSDAEE